MPIVGGFDPSINGFGWAFYDTDKPPSAIESGSIRLEGDDLEAKLVDLRVNLIPLLKMWQPKFVGIEEPRMFITQHPTAEGGKPDLLSPLQRAQQAAEGAKPAWVAESPATIVKGGILAGAAMMACLTWNIRCLFVAPNTWQTIIPATIKDRFPSKVNGKKDATAPKKRAREYCNVLRIASPNVDSRDACLIAVWTAGHAVELKMLQMASG